MEVEGGKALVAQTRREKHAYRSLTIAGARAAMPTMCAQQQKVPLAMIFERLHAESCCRMAPQHSITVRYKEEKLLHSNKLLKPPVAGCLVERVRETTYCTYSERTLERSRYMATRATNMLRIPARHCSIRFKQVLQRATVA